MSRRKKTRVRGPKCARSTCKGTAINGGRNRGLCRPHHQEFTRRRRVALGPDWLVDTAPVAAHITTLRAAGVGYVRIAALTGLHCDTVSLIARRRKLRTTADVARKILAVSVPAATEASQCLVPAVGTQRRLRALTAIGYTNVFIAGRLGMNETNVSRIHRHDRVCAWLAARADELFRELQLIPGPSVRARNTARKNGWPPPLAWDEDQIDNPDATPATNANDAAPFIEKYRDFRSLGCTDREIAELLRIKPKSLSRQLSRYVSYQEAS